MRNNKSDSMTIMSIVEHIIEVHDYLRHNFFSNNFLNKKLQFRSERNWNSAMSANAVEKKICLKFTLEQ